MSAIPELKVLPDRAGSRTKRGRVYCQLDRWAFDPRYTAGRCPLCGWTPEGAPIAPAWVLAMFALDWEIVGLILLVIALLVLGGVVAHAAGLLPALRLR